MTSDSQPTLRLLHAPDSSTVEMLYRTFGDLLIPLEELRVRYFRNLNATTFAADIDAGRVPLPLITLKDSRKSNKYVHVRHLAAWIDIRTYKADEELASKQTVDTQED
ncbi:pyocin activator PrtN family protein [Pseudomonas chlororaphis]|uniref:pyocin activator PrtN family protein n=1 Tax=Pseudomonas chlororaphis TaxID=587753 RepID=UPI003C1811AC